jgi:hypothetical protein
VVVSLYGAREPDDAKPRKMLRVAFHPPPELRDRSFHGHDLKFKDPNSMERMRTPWLRLESSTRSCANSKYHDGIHSYLFQMDMTEDQLVTVS